jgi:hypothetical protein
MVSLLLGLNNNMAQDMQTFEVEGKDGRIFEVDAPKGTSFEKILGTVKKSITDYWDVQTPFNKLEEAQVKQPVQPQVVEEQPIVNTGTLTDADVKMKESNNKSDAKNSKSSATGFYQMTDASRQDAIKFNPELKDKDYNDPLVQEEYRKAYKSVLTNQLTTKGVEANPDNINRAWVIGAGGMGILKDADPNALLKDVLPQSFFGKDGNKNPNLNNKTVKEFMNDPDPYSRK